LNRGFIIGSSALVCQQTPYQRNMEFAFSPLNVFGSGGSGFTVSPASPCFGTEVWPQPDARSFFMVVLDSHNWIVSLMAIQTPPGIPVVPLCVPP
jgi:hypothetical protein